MKILFFTLLLLTCFNKNSFAEKQENILMKFSISYNPTDNPASPLVLGVTTFKEELERLTNNKVKIKIFWDDSFAPTYDVAVSALKNRTLQLTQIPSGALTKFSKGVMPLGSFFLIPYPHYDFAQKIVDSNIGEIIRERVINDSGLRIVAFWDIGFRHITTIDKQIKSLSSLKGMKIRLQPMPTHIEGFRRLGADSVVIPWANLFAALQQKIVDGSENPTENIVDSRLYEVQKYLTLTGHTYEFVTIVASESYYQSLPDDVKAAWDKAVTSATIAYRKALSDRTKNNLEMLSKLMVVNSLSSEELKKFQDITKGSEMVAIKEIGIEYNEKIMSEIEILKNEYLEEIGEK